MKKRVLAMAMTLAMALSLLPVSALAVEETGDTGVDCTDPECSHVAEMGGKHYQTLQAAIDAIETSGEIDLLDNISGTQISAKNQMQFLSADKNIVIDLNEKTVTASADEAINIDAANVTLTVKNGKIINRLETGYYSDGVYAYKNSNNLDLRLENIEFGTRTQTIAVQGLTSNSNVTLEGCNITSDVLGIYYPPKSGTLSIIDTSITAPTGITVKGSNVEVSGNSVITANGEKVDPDEYYHGSTDPDSSDSLTLTGNAIYVESGYNDRNITLTITDGEFISKNNNAVQMYIKEDEVTSVKREVTITGGTFSSNVSEYVPENYVSVEEDGKYVVKPIQDVAVAQIGDDYYMTLQEAVTAASSEDKIILLQSVTGDGIIAQGDDNFVLDLNEKTYTINKTVGSAGTETNGMQFLKGAKVTIENGSIAFNNAKIGIKNYCDLTLNNVILTSTATANPVINNCGQLEVNGASTRIIANDTEWAITTGNYHKDDVITTTINDGEISSIACETPLWETGGATVDESVTTTINGGTIGKLGVYDWRASYGGSYLNAPLLTKWKMVVENGFIDTLEFDENSVGKVTINGGYFNSDPGEYLGEDRAVLSSDKTGYLYMVGEKQEGEIEEKPATKEPDVTVNIPNISEDDKNKVETSAKSVEADEVITEAARTANVSDAVKEAAVTAAKDKTNGIPNVSDDADIIIYKQTYLEITPTNYVTEDGEATLTMEITPMLQIVASTAPTADQIKTENGDQNAIEYGEPTPLRINTPSEITVTLPDAFKGETVYIKHRNTYYYQATADADGKITFVSRYGFSPFEFSTINGAAAEVTSNGETIGYNTLQEAVNAVSNNGTVTALRDGLSANTTKTVTVKNGSGGEIRVTVNGQSVALGDDESHRFVYIAPTPDDDDNDRPSSGSDDGPSGDYIVNVDRSTGGTVTVNPGRADRGDTVTVTVRPKDGYVLDELTVTDSRGNEVELDAVSDTRFTFEMPSGTVRVKADFVRAGQTTQPETPVSGMPYTDVARDAWYFNAVRYAYEKGLMTGVSDTQFGPNVTLTRAQLVQILYALEGKPAVTASAGYADVNAGDWYADAVNWAAANGVVSGVGDNRFAPNDALTREQLSVILYSYTRFKGYDATQGGMAVREYDDYSSISPWAAQGVEWAVNAGLISSVGENLLSPAGTATRAQAAQVLMNFCETVAQ